MNNGFSNTSNSYVLRCHAKKGCRRFALFSEYTHDLSFSLGFHDIFRGYFMGERILGGGKEVAKWAEKLELTLAHKNTRIM